jgi:hypothetical protein
LKTMVSTVDREGPKRGVMAAKAKNDARKMMELAIEVMRQSVPEPRGDGKSGAGRATKYRVLRS